MKQKTENYSILDLDFNDLITEELKELIPNFKGKFDDFKHQFDIKKREAQQEISQQLKAQQEEAINAEIKTNKKQLYQI